VGDVHQPLHASTRVSSTDPNRDSGGNLVKLSCTSCELHAFWDDLLGTKNNLKTVVKAARKLQAAGAALAAKSDEKDWITESFMESQQTVYASPIVAGKWAVYIDRLVQKECGKIGEGASRVGGSSIGEFAKYGVEVAHVVTSFADCGARERRHGIPCPMGKTPRDD